MNLSDPFLENARRQPGMPAIVTPAGMLDYGQLARAVIATAAQFQRAGLAPSDRVALAARNQLQTVVSSLALARIGVGQIAFQDTDPPLATSDLARRLKLGAIIAPQDVPSPLPRIEPPPGDLRALLDLADAPDEPATDGSLAYMFKRTSGTTRGVQKLVVETHTEALAGLQAIAGSAPRREQSRFLSFTSLGFAGALRGAMRCLSSGECLAIHDGISTVGAVVEFVERNGVDYIAGSPIHAARLLKIADGRGPLLSKVRVFRMSSTVVPDSLRAEIRERICANLVIFYGTTEAGPVTAAAPELVARVPGVVGHPLPGVEVRVLDGDARPLAAGKVGQVSVRSLSMAHAYVDDPEETARNFAGGWFLPGDLAEWTSEGALVHHGRADDTMVFDGVNIHPAEIESVLLRHPAVAEAAAFSIKSLEHGDQPVAAVVLKQAATESELLQFCRSWLGTRSVLKVYFHQQLPRNAAGKILRAELARTTARR